MKVVTMSPYSSAPVTASHHSFAPMLLEQWLSSASFICRPSLTPASPSTTSSTSAAGAPRTIPATSIPALCPTPRTLSRPSAVLQLAVVRPPARAPIRTGRAEIPADGVAAPGSVQEAAPPAIRAPAAGHAAGPAAAPCLELVRPPAQSPDRPPAHTCSVGALKLSSSSLNCHVPARRRRCPRGPGKPRASGDARCSATALWLPR